MTTAKPNPAPTGQPNPTLTELKALREEVAALRAQLSKPLNITDQVAKGVVIAGFFWLGLAFVFSLLVSQF